MAESKLDTGISNDSWIGISQYWPREPFRRFHIRTQRWAAMVCHRRAGKTVACVADLILDAQHTKKQDARFGYVAPLFVQAKDIAWMYVKRLTADIRGVELNESELRADFPNGARVRLYGADNPDRLRGGYFDGLILDEFADMRPSVWGEILRPTLMDRKGWAAFIGTPKGRNEFHSIYERACSDNDWFSLMLKASDSGLLPAEEIAAARKELTPEQFEQELECSFEAAIIGAYWGKELAQAEREGRIAEVPYERLLPAHTAWDLGVGDSTAIWFFQVSGNEIRVIDHYENHGQGLPHYASVIASKSYNRGDDWVPHDARVKELGSGRTRIESMMACGLKPKLVPDHKIMDGINAVRLTLPRIWFDRYRCADGLEALRQYQVEYDEKLRTFKDNPRHDWASHSCLVAGTRVRTAHGDIDIEQVQVGELVWTPAGYARVQAAGPVKRATSLIEVATAETTVICTPEHKFFTTRGLVTADALRYSDQLITGREWQCILIGLFSRAKRTSFRGIITDATSGAQRDLQIYIGPSGKMLTVTFQKAMTSIMSMVTHSTMNCAISNASRLPSTSADTLSNVSETERLDHQVRKLWSVLPNGTHHRLASSGTPRMDAQPGPTRSGILAIARTVVRRFIRLSLRAPNGATSIVRWRRFESAGEGQLVYDLTVEKHGCYQANGLMVSNSDAFRYLAMAYKEIKPAPAPKPRALPKDPETLADLEAYYERKNRKLD